MINKENLQKMIDNSDVVSFDIFDTLINRCVNNPIDIFKLMECELASKYGDIFSGFYERRINAEKQTRINSDFDEITIKEIYDHMNLETKFDVIGFEKNLEIELSEANTEMVEIYKLCIDKGKKIVICSDMYLDRFTIKSILHKNGIRQYSNIFLSSERRKTKSNGKLFREIITDLKISPDKILHIGDNFRSDFIQAKRQGLSAYLYKSKRKLLSLNQEYQILYGNMPKKFGKKYYWEQLGKYSLGNFLYGYTRWLIDEFNKKDFEHIFFLSRDGYIMQKSVELMASDGLKNKCRYLYASRRALIVPSLHLYNNYEDRCKIMFWNKHFKIKDWIENFGLNYERYHKKIEIIFSNQEEIFERENLITNEKLIRAYALLKDDIESNSKREYELLLEYLKQNEFSGRVAVVDAGWFGNLQHAIVKVCESANINVDISGYYIGIRENCKYFEFQKMKGYLYFGKEHPANQKNEIKSTAIVEAFFSHDEGSTRCYKKEKEVIVPVLKENNLDCEKCEILNIIQKAALDRVKQLNRIQSIDIQHYKPEVYFYGFCRIGITPTLFDAWIIARFVENVDIHGIGYYIKHPNRIRRDTHELDWKLAQLKRILCLKLNYLKVYDIVDRE